MRTILLAELRGSLRTWLGVSLAFVATNFALLFPGLVWVSVATAGGDSAMSLSVLAVTNMVFSALVSLSVLGTTTNLALSARRGALARLALGGATPQQIVRTVVVQLVAMSLLSSVVGAVLAMLALRPALEDHHGQGVHEGPPLRLLQGRSQRAGGGHGRTGRTRDREGVGAGVGEGDGGVGGVRDGAVGLAHALRLAR